MCPLTIHFFQHLNKIQDILYNKVQWRTESLEVRKKGKGNIRDKKERKERAKVIKIKKLSFHLWLINSSRIYKEPLYIEVGDPS